jgi:cation transport regulator ChaB
LRAPRDRLTPSTLARPSWRRKDQRAGKGASKEAWEKYNAQLAATEGYKAAQQQWGTGSSVQQAIQAATAAVQGLAGSDLKARWQAPPRRMSRRLLSNTHRMKPAG